MGLNIPFEAIAAYAIGLVLLYVLGYLLLVPLKWLWKLLVNGVLGGLILFGVNLIGGIFGVRLAVNFVTALIAGLLGIPGVLLLFLLKWML